MGKWLDALTNMPDPPQDGASKKSKGAFAPFDGTGRGDVSKWKSESGCYDKQGQIRESMPAKLTKASFGPLDGKSTGGLSENKLVMGDLSLSNVYHNEPSKLSKVSADGSLSRIQTRMGISNEPDPPDKKCMQCGSSRWWWDGFGDWCCNRCLADLHGNGGHHKPERR